MEIEGLYQRGFELRCEGNYPDAKDCFAKVLAMDPTHVNARHQMALILGFEGDFDGSLAALEALCTQYTGNLEVRYDFAMTQMMLGMYEEACANLKFILAKDPSHAKALQQVTYCQLHMDSGDIRERHLAALKLSFDGDHEASMLALMNLSIEVPEDTDILFDLAMIQMMLGHFE